MGSLSGEGTLEQGRSAGGTAFALTYAGIDRPQLEAQ
jgi:hypothetical protein